MRAGGGEARAGRGGVGCRPFDPVSFSSCSGREDSQDLADAAWAPGASKLPLGKWGPPARSGAARGGQVWVPAAPRGTAPGLGPAVPQVPTSNTSLTRRSAQLETGPGAVDGPAGHQAVAENTVVQTGHPPDVQRFADPALGAAGAVSGSAWTRPEPSGCDGETGTQPTFGSLTKRRARLGP